MIMKYIYILFINLSTFLYAKDYNVFDFFFNIPEISLVNIDERPTISPSFWRNQYRYSITEVYEFYNESVEVSIYGFYDKKIFPYNDSTLKLMTSFFSNEKEYDIDTLFYSNVDYSKKRDIYLDIKKAYKPHDLDHIPNYQSDIIYGQDGTRIERDFTISSRPVTGPEDRLTYYFTSDKGLFSEYIIEIYGLWDAFYQYHDESLLKPKLKQFSPPDGGERIIYLYTLTNEELDAYPDQSDPSIRLMHLLNEAMENFRFKDRPNAPPANLGTVNDNLVRLRSEPTLSGKVLGHVNTDEEVIVMEQSPEEQIIGGQKSRWYKVVSKTSCLKGWMFGSFLDFKTTP